MLWHKRSLYSYKVFIFSVCIACYVIKLLWKNYSILFICWFLLNSFFFIILWRHYDVGGRCLTAHVMVVSSIPTFLSWDLFYFTGADKMKHSVGFRYQGISKRITGYLNIRCVCHLDTLFCYMYSYSIQVYCLYLIDKMDPWAWVGLKTQFAKGL